MKKFILLILLFQFASLSYTVAQNAIMTAETKRELTALIEQYSAARDKRDTVLLKAILTEGLDQLVSSGEWREGVAAAVEGMQRSSATNEGKRTLLVEKSRLLTPDTGIIDARYLIEGKDGTVRKMWSTFILVREKETWKIAGIRNMLPSNQ
jgi:ketosteroid isomerase-like protein